MRRILEYVVIITLLFCALFAIYVLVEMPQDVIEIEFHSKPTIEPFEKYKFLVAKAFDVSINEDRFTIPKGFETDLASVPRMLWPILAPDNSGVFAPSILHDYLYTCHNELPRKIIDQVFYFALLENDVNERLAFGMYIAIRMFGGTHFHDDHSCNKQSPVQTDLYTPLYAIDQPSTTTE